MFCRNCGQALEDTARFCTACGTKLEDIAEAVAEEKAEPAVETAETPVVESVEVKAEEAVDEAVASPEEKTEEIIEEAVEEKTEEPAYTEPKAEEPAYIPPVEPKAESTYIPPVTESTEAISAPEEACSSKAMKPLSTIGTIGWVLLYMFPIIGLCFSIAMSFGATENINRRSLARCFLIFKIVALVLFIGMVICMFVFAEELLEAVNDFLGEGYENWSQLFDSYEFA